MRLNFLRRNSRSLMDFSSDCKPRIVINAMSIKNDAGLLVLRRQSTFLSETSIGTTCLKALLTLFKKFFANHDKTKDLRGLKLHV